MTTPTEQLLVELRHLSTAVDKLRHASMFDKPRHADEALTWAYSVIATMVHRLVDQAEQIEQLKARGGGSSH